MALQVDGAYVNDVLEKLSSNPTAQDLDFLIAAHTTIGYYTATTQGDADLAKAEREYAYADAYSKHKEGDPKLTGPHLEALATIDSMPYKRAELKASLNSRKISNLWSSVEQAINGLKHVERNTSVRFGP